MRLSNYYSKRDFDRGEVEVVQEPSPAKTDGFGNITDWYVGVIRINNVPVGVDTYGGREHVILSAVEQDFLYHDQWYTASGNPRLDLAEVDGAVRNIGDGGEEIEYDFDDDYDPSEPILGEEGFKG